MDCARTFAAVTVLFLVGHRTLRVYASVIVTLTILYVMAYLWGEQMNGTHSLFSPTVYADGQFFFSLGALIVTNTYITLLFFCIYLVKGRLTQLQMRNKKRRRIKMAISILAASASIAALCAYIHLTLTSLILKLQHFPGTLQVERAHRFHGHGISVLYRTRAMPASHSPAHETSNKGVHRKEA